MLTASMKRVRSVEEVEKVVPDIESMYDLFESLFRLSIEQGDAQTFNDVWNLGSGDVFITVDPQTDIHELEWQIERSDDEEEIEELENELEIKSSQQDAIENHLSIYENAFYRFCLGVSVRPERSSERNVLSRDVQRIDQALQL